MYQVSVSSRTSGGSVDSQVNHPSSVLSGSGTLSSSSPSCCRMRFRAFVSRLTPRRLDHDSHRDSHRDSERRPFASRLTSRVYTSRRPPQYSLYFSIMTVTSVGYGDVSASAFNPAEQLLCGVIMLGSGMLWGYLVGVFCSLAAASPSVQAFRDELSQVLRLPFLYFTLL